MPADKAVVDDSVEEFAVVVVGVALAGAGEGSGAGSSVLVGSAGDFASELAAAVAARARARSIAAFKPDMGFGATPLSPPTSAGSATTVASANNEPSDKEVLESSYVMKCAGLKKKKNKRNNHKEDF